MITAVDTNILIDVFFPDPVFGPISKQRLREASREGALVICEVVYSEAAGPFSHRSQLDEILQETGIELKPSLPETLWRAGRLWREFSQGRAQGPTSARRLLADYLVGAHAKLQADRLLTRDKGFYRAAFSGLRLV